VRPFVEELAKKLADRWVGLLVLPGALLVAAAWLAFRLGQVHALAWPGAIDEASAFLTRAGSLSAARQVGVLAVALLAVVGAGLATQALAPLTRALWLGRWPSRLVRSGVRRRRARWDRLVAARNALQIAHPNATRTPDQQEQVDRAAYRINRFALAKPGRPTWMGDRLHSVDQIALDQHKLDLAFGWSRLWLVLSETTRAELLTAESAFAAAVAVGTWAWPFLILGVVWWPAAVLAVVVGVVGWRRARAAVDDLAALSEAAVDLYSRDLARALGVGDADSRGPLTLDEGDKVTEIVRKWR
jgi:hypothetical protein